MVDLPSLDGRCWKFGIRAFVNREIVRPRCIFKKYPADFVVREIELDGSVLKLDVNAQPDLFPLYHTFEYCIPRGANPIEDSTSVFMSRENMFEELDILLRSIAKQDYEEFARDVKMLYDNRITEKGQNYTVLSRMLDRSGRTLFHALIRTTPFGTVLESKTDDGVLRVSLRNPAKKRQKRMPQRYLSFVLAKRNVETFDALATLSSRTRHPLSSFSISGTKDKFGITLQRVCLQTRDSMAINKLLELRTSLADKRLALGNICEISKPLRLGDHLGNEFHIILRGLDADPAAVNMAMASLISRGFVNYYGIQRFGCYDETPTHLIGLCMLREDWCGAVDLIMLPKGRKGCMDCFRDLWVKRGSLMEMQKGFRRKYVAENAVVNYLIKKCGESFSQEDLRIYSKGALESIPRNLYMTYLHSFQSIVWNRIATLRLEAGGNTVLIGDLVSYNGYIKTVRKEDICTGKYSIYDVVVPTPGKQVTYPMHESYRYSEVLEEFGISESTFSSFKYASLKGSYRHLLFRPVDIKYELVACPQSTEFISPDDVKSISSDVVEKYDQSQAALIKMSFSLPSSSYATMALREALKMEHPSSSYFNKERFC